jgi:CHAT domain-containing protein/lipopolysaccharide biosynthesis regulator YciM
MPHPKLLGFALCSVLLVPAVQLVGGSQPLQAARSGNRSLFALAAPSGSNGVVGLAAPSRLGDGLRGIGDRFLATDRITRPATVEEPVPLSATQIPVFLGASDPLPLVAMPETGDLDPLTGAGSPMEPLPLLAEPPQILAQANSRQSEADRLYQQGVQQYNTSQYQAALESWQAALAIYREIGNRGAEGDTLNALGALFRIAGQPQIAIDLHQQALDIAREIGDRADEGRALGNLGSAYFSLGQYERAIDFYEQDLALFRELGDRLGESNALSGLGITYHSLGQYDRAIDFHEQHLAIAREIGDRAGEGIALGNLGAAYFSLGQYDRAIDFHEQHLAIAREIGDRAGEGRALGNLGNAYDSLGQYDRAIDFHEQHLAIAREIGDRVGEASALGNLGVTYRYLDQYEQATYLFEEALAITREVGYREGEGIMLGNLGIVYNYLGHYAQAIGFHEQHLAIAREIKSPYWEAYALGNLGETYENLGQADRALEQYGQAVALLNQLDARAEEALFLSNIGQLLDDQAQPELAIIFLKASVDIREAIRGDIRGLDTDLQQSFTDTVAADYRLLADLLLQQDRILEAQRVLDLLKVQELDDYLNNIQRTARTASGVEYLEAEQDILERYDALQNRAITLGQERAQLAAKTARTPSETARLQELIQLEQSLAAEFNSFADSDAVLALLERLSVRTVRQTVGLEELSALRNQLDDLDAALIYPLVLEDRLELIITTADTEPLRRTIPVGRVDLNAAITDFRQVLEDPSQDPLPAAQQLYRWLIEPLEADLAAAGVTNLIYAPDSSLRYVPLAALHDGDQWLVEKGYRINHITAASLQELTAQPPTEPRILAGAFADEGTVHTVGESQLRGLYYAGEEVSQLQATLPNLQALFDSAFSLAAVTTELGSVNILHFATHAVFLTGDPSESFILFGNGEAPTLRDIGTWSLSRIDLVVLSACETGLGGFDNNGEQILGLGYQFQQRGAKAVVASLWRVSDPGTHALMTGFYAGLDQGQTKAEALRAAQVALITDQSVTTGGPLRAGARPTAEDGRALGANALPGYSHPYYWAPFILIGNGL